MSDLKSIIHFVYTEIWKSKGNPLCFLIEHLKNIEYHKYESILYIHYTKSEYFKPLMIMAYTFTVKYCPLELGGCIFL